MSFLFPFLKNINIFASFHVFGMRRSVMHFVYSFASCFAMRVHDNYPLGGATAIEVILYPFMPAVSVSVPPFSLDTTVGPHPNIAHIFG